MTNTIYFDSPVDDGTRRERLYRGQLFVFSPRPSTLALCKLADDMLREAFSPVDPIEAQYHMPVEDFVSILAPLKPKFIHHPEAKRLIQEVLLDMGCDLDRTYLDVPRLRAVTSDGYLTSGVGYAHHPHRDTWYSAPLCQLNWWLPIYRFASDSSMAFHPRYWDQPVKNGSSGFSYYEWNNNGRKTAAQHIKTDTRNQPKAEEEVILDPQYRIVCEPGGIILFSAAQMHSTVPNTSGAARFSIDFRTMNFDDLVNMLGAPNVDSAPQDTSLTDFMRGSDLKGVPNEVLKVFGAAEPTADPLVLQP
jgi:hypothetical protein